MRLVLLFQGKDVQRLIYLADLNKKLIKARPMAQLRNDIKNLVLSTCLTGVPRA